SGRPPGRASPWASARGWRPKPRCSFNRRRCAMITCASVSKEAIAEHYNQGTLFYRLLWGEHIHHRLWHADESPREAQLQTVQYLADQADIQPWERVLDVGCGMGGSAIYLAHRLGCHVTGLTLSRFQRCWAGLAAWFRGVSRRVRFTVQDVEPA